MSIQVGNRPPFRAVAEASDAPHWSRPSLVVLLERPNPAPWSLRQVAGLARRLGADVLVATVATYERGLDDLDRLRLQVARDGVREATSMLIEQGARATGVVRMAADGDQVVAASDLADQVDADLVIVIARHRSWFRLLPGSRLAHHLMERGRRPLLVIPDHGRRDRWSHALAALVCLRAPQPLTGPSVERLAS